MPSNGNLKLVEKISGYLLQNPLKLVTSLSYKKPCLTNLQVSWWCLVKKLLYWLAITCMIYSNQLRDTYKPHRLVCMSTCQAVKGQQPLAVPVLNFFVLEVLFVAWLLLWNLKQSEHVRYLYNSHRLDLASCMDCTVFFEFSDKLDRQDKTLANSMTDGQTRVYSTNRSPQ